MRQPSQDDEWAGERLPEVVLLASMGHSLRTPLNQVLGFSELLGEEVSGPLNDKQRAQAAGIARAGEQLLSIVDDLVMLAEVRAGSASVLGSSSVPRVLVSMRDTGSEEMGVAVEVSTASDSLGECAVEPFWLERLARALIQALRHLSRPDGVVEVRHSNPWGPEGVPCFEVACELRSEIALTEADRGADVAAFAALIEKRVHGSGVRLLLAAHIAAAAGGIVTLRTVDRSRNAYVFRCELPAPTPGSTRKLEPTHPLGAL